MNQTAKIQSVDSLLQHPGNVKLKHGCYYIEGKNKP